MDNVKLEKFTQFFDNAFTSVLYEMAEIEAVAVDELVEITGEAITIIVGTTGKNKGRILFQAGDCIANKIAENMNSEPVASFEERNLFLSEFVNTFCGNGVTKINNYYLDSQLRLTPPAVFTGVGLNIVTPNIDSMKLCLKAQDGYMILDIGFEGE